MKRILFILMTFVLGLACCVPLPAQNVSKTIGQNDSVNVTVKFEKIKLSKEETTAQAELNALLSNSLTTTGELSRSVDRMSTAIEENIKLNKVSKTEMVANQIGVTIEKVKHSFKLNAILLLLSLIPTLIIVFWAMLQFLTTKGLDIGKALAGTAIVALYGLIGSVVLYFVTSLIFNSQYFVIKDLMRSMF
jgi:hypothetical protein